MTIGSPDFCVFLYLNGVHFRGELQHGGDVSQQKVKCRPTREIGGVHCQTYYMYMFKIYEQLVSRNDCFGTNIRVSFYRLFDFYWLLYQL